LERNNRETETARHHKSALHRRALLSVELTISQGVIAAPLLLLTREASISNNNHVCCALWSGKVLNASRRVPGLFIRTLAVCKSVGQSIAPRMFEHEIQTSALLGMLHSDWDPDIFLLKQGIGCIHFLLHCSAMMIFFVVGCVLAKFLPLWQNACCMMKASSLDP
jgi:hypothetical protein